MPYRHDSDSKSYLWQLIDSWSAQVMLFLGVVDQRYPQSDADQGQFLPLHANIVSRAGSVCPNEHERNFHREPRRLFGMPVQRRSDRSGMLLQHPKHVSPIPAENKDSLASLG